MVFRKPIVHFWYGFILGSNVNMDALESDILKETWKENA